MSAVEFVLRGDHITLDALLKATGLAASGGNA
jgi:ribosome-associated protein YbcJ (S4-like RNA binding protein)